MDRAAQTIAIQRSIRKDAGSDLAAPAEIEHLPRLEQTRLRSLPKGRRGWWRGSGVLKIACSYSTCSVCSIRCCAQVT